MVEAVVTVMIGRPERAAVGGKLAAAARTANICTCVYDRRATSAANKTCIPVGDATLCASGDRLDE